MRPNTGTHGEPSTLKPQVYRNRFWPRREERAEQLLDGGRDAEECGVETGVLVIGNSAGEAHSATVRNLMALD